MKFEKFMFLFLRSIYLKIAHSRHRKLPMTTPPGFIFYEPAKWPGPRRHGLPHRLQRQEFEAITRGAIPQIQKIEKQSLCHKA
jgi:hypothetical protein